jgi:tetratricopeptide (TPR) repeat protein
MTDGIILIVFGAILLLVLAILTSALSDDAGFVLMVWHQWQIQTSVGFALLSIVVLTILLIILFLMIRAVWFGSEYFYQKRKALTRRKTLMSLDAAIRQRLVANFPAAFAAMEDSLTNNSLNLKPFNKKKGSALHLLQADVACQAGLYAAAHEHLTHIDSDDHELATLLRAKICLASGDYSQAQSTLEMLLTYSERGIIEPVREALQPDFDRQVGVLWSDLASKQPWHMLSYLIFPATKYIDWSLWLKALSTHELPEDAADRLTRLLQIIPLETQDHFATEIFALLVKAGQYSLAMELTERVLATRLDAMLLAGWMSVCIEHAVESAAQSVDNVLVQLEQRYPAQPDVVLARVRWMRHLAASQPEQIDVALALLNPYQNHPLVQKYTLIWQIESQSNMDEQLRTTLLNRMSVQN